MGLLAIFAHHIRSFFRLLPIGKIFRSILGYNPCNACLVFHCRKVVLVIISISSSHVVPWHGSLGQISIHIIGISHYLIALFIGNGDQFGFPIIGIAEGKFCFPTHCHIKGGLIVGTVISIILNNVLILGEFGCLTGNLPGYVSISKSSAVLGFHIPIGIVSICMGGLFPGLLFLCHHLRQTVLIVIGVFQSIAVLVYCFRQVAVHIIGIGFPPAFRVSISNQLIFSIILIPCLGNGIRLFLSTDSELIGFSRIGKCICIVSGILHFRYRKRQRFGHSGKLAHFVPLDVIDILDILCFLPLHVAFDHDKVTTFIISILGFCRPVTVNLFVLFRHISRIIILCRGFLVTSASIFLFLWDLRLNHPSKNVVLILGCHILLGSSRGVLLCHLPLLVIVCLDSLGLPFRLSLFPALCLRLADVSVIIISGEGLCLIGRKPLPVLLFSGYRVFFSGSAKIITFIGRHYFYHTFATDIDACL